ncbi:protein N-terminal asparagine amidohydrolase isoform X2 [Mercurialis annua]|uniref:protein N-terminal asparagine amidohydrolase isoform X2 n=1 Tax=Mercurialis annua TaxID=3986 RepID=UPI00215F671E|nr:protein N-terminal asparagine amidohydrolase isoform X2 [Mercurialis annua]
MILVDGVPSSQGTDTLMEHPLLLAASLSFKAKQEHNFSQSNLQTSMRSRWIYIFQREYATVDPQLVDYIGTDEATTCVGLVIRNRKNGMISVAHMDSPKVVEHGLTQMLSALVNHNDDHTDLDVHLIGGFEDVSSQHANGTSNSKNYAKLGGYSFPLCTKIIETLGRRQERFHIQTLFILSHNTRRDSQGNAYPIINGFMVETSTGSLIPARFDRTTRGPDEIVRRIRVCASGEDPSWNEILLSCSTSPSAEGPDFVDNERRQWDYLIKHPDWQYTFPKRQPRIFERSCDGVWKRLLPSTQDEPLFQNPLLRY